MIAAAAIFAIAAASYKGARSVGLRGGNFIRAWWIPAAAMVLAAAAVVVADQMQTLHTPQGGPIAFIKTYWAYALWSGVQQLLLQGFFLSRFSALSSNKRQAAFIAALLFALAHLPNPVLTPVTLFWGLAACLLFFNYRTIYPLAVAHAILGIAVAITVPGHVDHNMRVGLGYLTYRNHPQKTPPTPVALNHLP
jgi:membrane protease YdiL (CAAX protease family)